jgi:hypothetical protein
VSKLAWKPSPGVESVAIVVHGPPPVGWRSKSTWSMPEPESAAEPVRVFVARRYGPGSSWLVVGTVLSMRTFVAVVDAVLFPATSWTTTRSW